jgi:hypothetical protein
VDTSAVGSFSVSCTATDRADNTQTAGAPYVVGFGFDGFSAPVDNATLNTAKAGRAIPLKFHITDAGGPVLNITSYTLTSQGEACDTSDLTAPVEEYAAGNSGLQNHGDGNYQINWKTDGGYAGQCRQLDLKLGGDPTPHSADFTFTK